MKTLLEVVKELDTLNNEQTIYATLPWLPASEAVVMHENSWSQNNTLTKSFVYFIEVAIAQDFMTDWIASNDTTEAKCERLIEYAIKDS